MEDPVGATEVVPIIALLNEAERVWAGYKLSEMIEVIQNVKEAVAVGESQETPAECVEIAVFRKLMRYTVRSLPFCIARGRQ